MGWRWLVVCWLTLCPVPGYAQQSAGGARFDWMDIQIDGNTVLDDVSLERAVYGFLGADKNVEDVENARKSLEKAYRDAGYPTVLVTIPEQDVNEGLVRLEVVEGSIESLRVTGSAYHSPTKIREAVPALAKGQVPHMPTVQAQMTAMAQQTSNRNATPIFRAGSTPGKLEVELRVKDELPLHGSVEMNSRQSGNTPYARLIGSVRYENLWQAYHSAALQYQVAPEQSDRVSVWSGTYVLPTHWADTRLALYGIGVASTTPTGSALGTSVGDTTVIGAGNIFGLRLVKPVATDPEFIGNWSGGLDYKSFDQAGNLLGQQTKSIQYLSFMSGYDALWRHESGTTALTLNGFFSFDGLGNNAAQFAAKRVNRAGQGASPNYMYLTANAKHLQKLPEDFSLQMRLQGQISSTFLISNEQFSAGGPVSVRGYYQTQVLGDDGLNLSMELYSPRLLADTQEMVQNFRALAFADWAGLWASNQSVASEYAQLASTGLGLRLKMFKTLSGELDWSYPLISCRGGCATLTPVSTGQQRVDFRFLYEF